MLLDSFLGEISTKINTKVQILVLSTISEQKVPNQVQAKRENE